MRTTWRVEKVTVTRGSTLAELIRVEWFKPNPEYTRVVDDEFYEGDLPDEFIVAEPGEPAAECFDPTGEKMTLDITDGLDLKPGDNVTVTLDALDRVPM